MELLTLPKLRHQQLQTVTEDSLKICEGLTQLQVPIDKVNLQFERFKGGMTRDKATATEKKELDNTRDHLVANFIKAVVAESYFPHNNNLIKETLSEVVKVVSSYGTKIVRLSYNEESAAIDNMLTDLSKINFDPLEPTGLERWLPPIQQANNEFKTAAQEYIAESANENKVDSATEVAPVLMDALEALYSMVYAYLKIDPTDELRNAYNQLQILLNGYR